MKSANSIALASWLLKYLTFGRDREALTGDLLEELRSGRSPIWYWRQILSAIGVGLLRKSRDCVLALIFSIAWSILYPSWQLCLAQIMPQRLASIDFPYSSALHSLSEMLPALLFVWIGLLFYLVSRIEKTSKISGLRILASLSISLNVLFMAIVGMRIHLAPSQTSLGDMSNKNLIPSSHYLAICIPLALSLFSATVPLLSRSHSRGTAPLPG